jgi:Nup93/Nic96
MFEVGVPMVTAQDLDTVLNLYAKAKNMDGANHFKIGVLALLCGQLLSSFSTIEDYLFGRLWVALQDRENPVLEITEIGSSIRKYGPEYFGADENGGWAYALPLIASQQFNTALAYLAGAGGPSGLLQAVHLGLVFSLTGLEVTDLDRALTTGSPMKRSLSEDFVTALLVNYAGLLEREPSAGVLVALQYLLKIPSKEKSMREVAALVFRSPDQMQVLAGSLNEAGERRNAELDKLLQAEDVSVVLGMAADMFKGLASIRSKAELSASLYMRAYLHAKLLQFLNQLMSPADVADADKDHWATQSQWFYNCFLAKTTLVLESVQRGGHMDLVATNQTLIEFRAFFNQVRLGRFEEAFDMISRTERLPLSSDALDTKISEFKDLDPILKDAFPAVLRSTVECLFEMHRRLKSESRRMSPTVEARLKDLQTTAKIMYLFASFTNMPATCRDDIRGLKARMI